MFSYLTDPESRTVFYPVAHSSATSTLKVSINFATITQLITIYNWYLFNLLISSLKMCVKLIITLFLLIFVQYHHCNEFREVSGGGNNFEVNGQLESGERGEKGYKAIEVKESGNRGHHDKEGQKTNYGEKGGTKQGNFNQNGYYGVQRKEEKGDNGYSYQDQGNHLNFYLFIKTH